jgi:DNA-binding CsgD family transcriptional regulator
VLGTPDFTEPFMSVVQLTGASQVTAFAYHPDKVECLVSRNFQSDDEGGILAAAYLDGGFRDDPLYRRAIAMDPGECIVERLEDLLPRISSRYLAMFFGSAGFRTKIATMVAQDSLRMVANLYFREPTSEPFGGMQELNRLIGRTLATHFLRLNPPDFPFPLAVLSERERQVCLGMLAGKKAEIIAEEVGVGLSSVVTYRQRAYHKLGISSRGELFAICHSWHSQQARPQMVRARLPN